MSNKKENMDDIKISLNLLKWLKGHESKNEESLWENLSNGEKSVFKPIRELLLEREKKISELEQKFNAQERELAFYMTGIRSLAAPVFIKNDETKYDFINTMFLDVFDADEDEFIGKNNLELEYLSKESQIELQEEDVYVTENLKTAHREIELSLKDGLKKCWYWTTGFKDKFGRVGSIGTFTNITTLLDQNDELNSQIDELASEKKEIEKLAQIDPLTGLYNKLSMNSHMQKLIRAHEIYGTSFSVLMFDIDHFKQVNDNYGHLEGDNVLRKTGQLTLDSTRQIDVCIRYGGEEFLILLAGTPLENAKTFAQRFCLAFPEKILKSDNSPVTISIGVVEFKENESIEDLIRRADSNLYSAKRGGRNQVVAS